MSTNERPNYIEQAALRMQRSAAPAPRGIVLYPGTPEYEAAAQKRAEREAKDAAQRAEREAKRSEILSEIERTRALLRCLEAEIEPAYEELSEARANCEAAEKKAQRAYERWHAGTLSSATASRHIQSYVSAADAHNALVPPYNARVATLDAEYETLRKLEQQLRDLSPSAAGLNQ